MGIKLSTQQVYETVDRLKKEDIDLSPSTLSKIIGFANEVESEHAEVGI